MSRHCFHSIVSYHNGQLFKVKKVFKSTVHYLLNTKWQSDRVSDLLVYKVEHLAANELDVSLRRWWRPITELKERGGQKQNSK